MAAYPGNYATPGVAWPGAAWPGQPVTPVTLYTFSGPVTLIYPDYIDVQASHTLVAVPGGTYSIAPAGQGGPASHPSSPPPDGLWTES